jgi:hypothetical protein
MNRKNKSNRRSKKTNKRPKKTGLNRSWITITIALYITFLLLSMIPYLADRSIEPEMQESYEYHLRYSVDGRQTHYYVERVNTSMDGRIDLVYTTSSNSLVVKTYNIKVLHIFCRSMYEDECKKVYGFDPSVNSNYYKWYFIEKNHLNVNIDADHEIEELKFIDTPLAHKVIVDGVTWVEGIDYFYTDEFSTALSDVPGGFSNVDLYFKSIEGTPPTAVLDVSKTLVSLNEKIIFDGSKSFDTDGAFTRYIFDFGDGNFSSGATHFLTHGPEYME